MRKMSGNLNSMKRAVSLIQTESSLVGHKNVFRNGGERRLHDSKMKPERAADPENSSEEDLSDDETNGSQKKNRNNRNGTIESRTNDTVHKNGASGSPVKRENHGPIGSPYRKRDDDNNTGEGALKEVGKFALKTALISGLIIGGTAVALPLIGFGALGPIGGSLAAAYQSSVLGGTIASGSAFATLQSVGMVGLSAAAKGSIVAGSAAVSGATSVYSKLKSDKRS